jgi:hypothetical protein
LASLTPDDVLKLISSSDAAFLVIESDETERRSGSAMAARIRFKYTLAGSPKLTAEQFIDQFCTTSSLHGTDYQVQPKGAQPTRLADWLREQVRRAEDGPAPK